MTFSNSGLVTYTRISKNRNINRMYPITRFTPHVIVGQWTAKKGVDYFAETDRQCSANYVIGKDGAIGLSVEEKDRAWTSSNADNDHRAITVEIASDTVEPYKITDEAWDSLVELAVDVCKRYNKTKLLWLGDKDKTLKYKPQESELVITVHRWFANKACPGDYVYNRLGELADTVTKRLSPPATTPNTTTKKKLYKVQVGAFSNKSNAERLAQELKGKGYSTMIVETA